MARRPVPLLKDQRVLGQRRLRPVSRLRMGAALGRRRRGGEPAGDSARLPPETWYEPRGDGSGEYRIVVHPPGNGYVHVLTPEDIRQRLAQVPSDFLRRLEVVQLSRMTRKKRSFPCYGMQWGAAIYLYPIEESLVEYYARPPRPAELREAAMYGAKWVQESPDLWALHWTWPAIRDYYLNNVLIHELGHIVDNRNRRFVDRERFAEWFAIQYGYKPSRAELVERAVRRVVHRHG
ncbi:MAG: hypothetical protein KatS3mg110_1264 [Pirellulaceae bacterium]|nr:MAG: hypothetical protein KatS3mg110_1264 [Pirellulaceae bacterium]